MNNIQTTANMSYTDSIIPELFGNEQKIIQDKYNSK